MQHNFKNKVIVVTGGSGYIGSSLIEKLRGKTKRLICVSRKNLKLDKGVENWKLDITDYTSWKKIVGEADIIFHLACNTSIYEAEKNPSENLMVNLFPITLLINAAKELSRIPRVVFASTASVYGLTDSNPTTEKVNPNPITFYCLHKFFGEKKLTMATQNNIISGISLRLSNVYGKSLNESSLEDRGIINKITKMSINGKNLQIYDNGGYLRDYIYIDDVINAFLYAGFIDSNKTVFNVASGFGTSLKEVFLLVSNKASKYTGNKVNINSIEWPVEADEIEKRNFVGSNALLKSESLWSPTVSLDKGIDLLINYYVKEKNNEAS